MFYVFLFTGIVNAQSTGGIVLYGVILPINEHKRNFFSDESLNDANKIEFELKFNLKESIFEVIDQQITPSYGSRDLACHSKAVGTYYKNTSDAFLLKQSNDEELGELIVKVETNNKWTLINESKVINDLTCYKATSEILFPNEKINGKLTPLTAWYCPTIPVSFGPKCIGGLPGLILELVNDNVTFFAKKINLNLQNEIIVKKPSKGKLITNLEYKKLIDDFYADVMAGKK